MNESFFATLKLITSEEILSEVLPQEEAGTDFFVLSNPIVIAETQQVDTEKGVMISGMMPRKWMLFSNEDLSIVYKQHVISISEMDKFGADFYRKALVAAKCSSPVKRKIDTKNHSGFIGKIDKFRKKLQKDFDGSPDLNKE